MPLVSEVCAGLKGNLIQVILLDGPSGNGSFGHEQVLRDSAYNCNNFLVIYMNQV